jgi:hypothetical protein
MGLSIENVKDLAEAIALVSGGVYFGIKAYSGYFRVNLSLSITCSRQRCSETEDYLVVCAKLSKGGNGSLTLHDARARVTFGDSRLNVSFPGVDRSSYDTSSDSSARKVIAWERVSETSPFLKIIPGEQTELSVSCRVPPEQVCTVEVAVLGQQTNWKPVGQWKASCISLPAAV